MASFPTAGLAGRLMFAAVLAAVAFVPAQAGGAATSNKAARLTRQIHKAMKTQRAQRAQDAAMQNRIRAATLDRLHRGHPGARPTVPVPPVPIPESPGAGVVPGAGSPYKDHVGVSSHTIWYQPAKQLEDLTRMRANGLTWAREDFHWGAFEQSKGVWNWGLGDTFMRNASKAGINVLATIAYSADWAASGPNGYYPPRDPAEYANFCRRLIERYGPNGNFWRENPDLNPRPLRAVEIWNEPWLNFFWRSGPDPAAYARLLRAAATAIRAADPSVKILASADLYGADAADKPVTWFSALLAADPDLFKALVDAYSVHAYSQERSPMDNVTRQLWRFDRFLATADMAAKAGAAHPVWITEFGWSTYQAHPDGVSEETQALYIRQALKRAHEEFPGVVERSFLYTWGDHPTNDLVGAFSLFRTDGTPKPALAVLKSLLT